MLIVQPPPPDLAAQLESALVLRSLAAGAVSRFPAMPRAMLTVTLGAAGPLPAAFHALSTRPSLHHHPHALTAVGLVLLPATAARLLGASTGALTDATLPWAAVAGAAEAQRLDDDMAQASTDGQRLQALLASLRRSLARGAARPQAARAALLDRLCHTVGQHGLHAAPLLGLGERQLERRCQALLALSPKRLQRLQRFHDTLTHALRQPPAPAAGQALDAGYYDQSHLARESRLLAGAPLRGLLAAAHDGGAWWPLASQRTLRHHR